MKKLPLSRRFHTFGLGCLMLATLLVPSLADPSEPFIRPEKVVSVTGNVQNATALAGGSGAATLTWTGSGPAPQIILDYGRDVGGLPVFDISIVAGPPKLTAIYSEAQSWLMPNGDGEAPGVPTDPAITPDEVSFVGNAGGSDLSRVKHLCRCKPGVILHPLIQGGERFQAITLTTPGSVTLRSVGIRSKIFHPRPSLNSGRFWSSDEALNEIWSLGEYTLHLNQVPARSLPTTWTATSEGVRVRGSQYSGYQGGADWTDYTSEFDVKILANEAAWLVRASSLDGLRIVLGANNAALGITQPNTIRAYSQARKALLGEAALPFDLRPGTWHHVRTVVGSTVQVYIDDQPVLTLDASNVAGLFGAPITAGWLGFGNVDGGDAVFRNLSVADTTGQTLYQSALKSASVLDQFAAGTNVLPVILDGAKRDRWVWAGDVAIAA